MISESKDDSLVQFLIDQAKAKDIVLDQEKATVLHNGCSENQALFMSKSPAVPVMVASMAKASPESMV